MFKVFKTDVVRIWEAPEAPRHFSQLFCPETVLFTHYVSFDTDLGKLVNPEGRGSGYVKLGTGIGTNFERGRSSRRVVDEDMADYGRSGIGALLKGYSGDVVEAHAEKCSALEAQLGADMDIVANVQVQFTEGFVTSVSRKGGTVALETKFRAPGYFMPDGFPIDGKKLFEARVYSEARKTSSGTAKSSGVFAADNSPILIQDPKSIAQLLDSHAASIQAFLRIVEDYYVDGDCYRAQALLEDGAETLSYVDHRDYQERQFMQAANGIARAICEDSPLKDSVKAVILYGSLARRDKIPGDIDLMLVVDSDTIDPFRYFSLDDLERPKRYNVSDVTDGIARELGIVPSLLRIGSKRKRQHSWDSEYPDEASNIQFSELGGGVNLCVVSRAFFEDAALREKYMRICFTPTYFQDALTDGLAFDASSGEFSVPTREVYSGVISALKEQLGQAVVEKWPNVGNVRPEKTF